MTDVTPSPLAEALMSFRRIALILSTLTALAPSAAGQAPPSPYVGANFLSITRTQTNAIGGGLLEPPDTMGAVGLNHYVQFNNGSFTVYNKAGTQVQQMNDTAFWNAAGVASANSTSDPRILYDPNAQRWIAVMISISEATNNRILIARSDTSDPSGTWKSVIVTPTNGRFADYPTFGMTADNIAVGTINFTGAGAPTGTVTLYNLPKTSLFAATPTTTSLTTFERTAPNVGFLLQPTVNYSPTSTGSMVVMSPSSSSFSNYVRTTVTNPALGTATYSTSPTNVPITSYNFAPNAQQPGSGVVLDTIDDRFYTSVIHQGNLLYMANVVRSPTNRAAIRFTVVNATTNTTVFQTTLSEANADYFYPAVAVNPSGDIVIGMNITRTTGNPNGTLMVSPAAIIGSTTNFTSWTFNNPTVLFTGIGNYTGTRWGDYSATTLDPADPGIFWTTQERTGSSGNTNNWGTQVTEVIPVKANELRWRTAAGGSFGTGSAWFGGTAAGAADHAIFGRWATTSYAVNVPDGTANDRLSVRQTGTGTVTFNIPTTWNLTNTSASTPSLAVAEFQGTSNVVFNMSGGSKLSTRHTVIAGQSGAVGNVTVSGSATGGWENLNDVYLGGTAAAAGGTGTITVQDSYFTVGGTLKIWNSGSSVTTVNVNNFTVGGLTNGPGATPMVNLTGSNPRLIVNGDGTTVPNSTFDGVIAGVGSVQKSNAGTFTLTNANTYTGTTIINPNGGTLRLTGNGSIAASPSISVGSNSTFDVSGVAGGANFATGVFPSDRFALASGQSLHGSGTVTGSVGARNGSTISPGTQGASDAGNLSITGDVAFQSSSATYRVNLGGPTAGTEHDRLTVIGAVVLNSATLDLSLDGGFAPLTAYQLFIIDNDGMEAVDGTFNGLTQGGSFTLGDLTVFISYQGDLATNQFLGGNDVVLSFTTPVPEPATVFGLAAAGFGLAALVRRKWRGSIS